MVYFKPRVGWKVRRRDEGYLNDSSFDTWKKGEGKNLPRCSDVNDVTIQNILSLISSIRIARFDIIIVDPVLILLYLTVQPSESVIKPDNKAAIV